MATDKQLEVLTEEQQQEILEKYDTESNVRRLGGVMKWIVFGLLLAFSLFQLYTAIFGQFTAYIQRSIHLGFGLTLFFFYSLHEKRHLKQKFHFMTIYWRLLRQFQGCIGRLTIKDL